MIEWWGPILIEYYAGSEGIGMTMIGSADWLAHPGSVGRAIFGKLHICGPGDEELPAGEDGLVYFENAVLPTYPNDPAKNAEEQHPEGRSEERRGGNKCVSTCSSRGSTHN